MAYQLASVRTLSKTGVFVTTLLHLDSHNYATLPHSNFSKVLLVNVRTLD